MGRDPRGEGGGGGGGHGPVVPPPPPAPGSATVLHGNAERPNIVCCSSSSAYIVTAVHLGIAKITDLHILACFIMHDNYTSYTKYMHQYHCAASPFANRNSYVSNF